MPASIQNLFQNIPDHLHDELVEIITESDGIRIERIVSKGHSSPDAFWYDQDKNELVILLKGKATLRIEGEIETRLMGPGDYLDIKAHVRHQVAWTEPLIETVWLAVHY